LNILKLRQIGFADMVVLNKVDLVGPEHIEVAKEWINHHLQRIRIIEATRCDVSLEILLAVGRFDPAKVVLQERDTDHFHRPEAAGRMFDTWSYEHMNKRNIYHNWYMTMERSVHAKRLDT
jgi:G3E family GTPase